MAEALALVELDPDLGTPEADRLLALAIAIEHWERPADFHIRKGVWQDDESDQELR